jgi:hypothetical protein
MYSYEHVNRAIESVGKMMTQTIQGEQWTAFFDESGKLANTEVVAFGGCVGPMDATAEFSRGWEAFLVKNGLMYTSMKDAMHFRGPYLGWKDNPSKRDDVLRGLARFLADSRLFMIATPMTTAEFKGLPQAQREKFWNDVEYAGLEACIIGVLSQSPRIFVNAICDLSEEYSEKCIKLFHKLRARDEVIKTRCVAITFADDKRTSGLQAADMIAYCSRANHQRSKIPPDPLIDELVSILASHGTSEDLFAWKADGKGLAHGEIE